MPDWIVSRDIWQVLSVHFVWPDVFAHEVEMQASLLVNSFDPPDSPLHLFGSPVVPICAHILDGIFHGQCRSFLKQIWSGEITVPHSLAEDVPCLPILLHHQIKRHERLMLKFVDCAVGLSQPFPDDTFPVFQQP